MVCKMGCASALTAPNRCPSPLSLRAPARTRALQQSPGLLLPWRVALFESLNNCKIKSTRRNALCFLLERITRLARCASARTGTHAGTATVPWTVATLTGCPVRVLRKDTTNKKAQGEMPCAFYWSGLRDSNSLPPPWQGGALPDELNPQTIVLLYPAGAGLSSPFFAGGNKKCRPLVGITIGTTTYR